MFLMIMSNVPVWVWVLLVALVALGLIQTRTRQMSTARAFLLPLGLTVLSLSGVVSNFGAKLTPLCAWLIATVAALLAAKAFGAWRGASWSAATSRFKVPGSWLPLVLILSIFVVKFYVGVNVAMHPELRTDTQFALIVCLIYGVFSGVFLARGLNFWTLMTSKSPTSVTAG